MEIETSPGRLIFPTLVHPRRPPFDRSGRYPESFSAGICLDDAGPVFDALIDAASEDWPNAAELYLSDRLKLPVWYKTLARNDSRFILSAKNYNRPAVVDAEGMPMPPEQIEGGQTVQFRISTTNRIAPGIGRIVTARLCIVRFLGGFIRSEG